MDDLATELVGKAKDVGIGARDLLKKYLPHTGITVKLALMMFLSV